MIKKGTPLLGLLFLAALLALAGAARPKVHVHFSGGGIRAQFGSMIAACEIWRRITYNENHHLRDIEIDSVVGLSGGAWGSAMLANHQTGWGSLDPCLEVERVLNLPTWGNMQPFNPFICTTRDKINGQDSCYNGWKQGVRELFNRSEIAGHSVIHGNPMLHTVVFGLCDWDGESKHTGVCSSSPSDNHAVCLDYETGKHSWWPYWRTRVRGVEVNNTYSHHFDAYDLLAISSVAWAEANSESHFARMGKVNCGQPPLIEVRVEEPGTSKVPDGSSPIEGVPKEIDRISFTPSELSRRLKGQQARRYITKDQAYDLKNRQRSRPKAVEEENPAEDARDLEEYEAAPKVPLVEVPGEEAENPLLWEHGKEDGWRLSAANVLEIGAGDSEVCPADQKKNVREIEDPAQPGWMARFWGWIYSMFLGRNAPPEPSIGIDDRTLQVGMRKHGCDHGAKCNLPLAYLATMWPERHEGLETIYIFDYSDFGRSKEKTRQVLNQCREIWEKNLNWAVSDTTHQPWGYSFMVDLTPDGGNGLGLSPKDQELAVHVITFRGNVSGDNLVNKHSTFAGVAQINYFGRDGKDEARAMHTEYSGFLDRVLDDRKLWSPSQPKNQVEFQRRFPDNMANYVYLLPPSPQRRR